MWRRARGEETTKGVTMIQQIVISKEFQVAILYLALLLIPTLSIQQRGAREDNINYFTNR